MATHSIIETFDVGEDVGLGICPGKVLLKVDLLTFHELPELPGVRPISQMARQ
jgi:hypothetical protein